METRRIGRRSEGPRDETPYSFLVAHVLICPLPLDRQLALSLIDLDASEYSPPSLRYLNNRKLHIHFQSAVLTHGI